MANSLVGIGLRYPHLKQFVSEKPNIGWVEVHSENFYSLGGPDFDCLVKVREDYPISLHGIGMSLGSGDGIDKNHLMMVKNLINIINPFLVSDHLSWNSISDKFLPDLLPTPFNNEALEVFVNNIDEVQSYLGREILIENPSTYFEYETSTMPEYEFLNILSERTGAKVILDLNNIYVSGLNNGWSPEEYISNLDTSIVKEIHLAGHFVKETSNSQKLYVDSHSTYVSDEVWHLYGLAIQKFGEVHSLLEWDVDIPDLSVLLDESRKAENYLDKNFKRQYA